MKEKVNKFLNILKIELIDLEDDITTLEDLYKQREKNHEITNYVLLENITVIQREIRAIQRLVDGMDDIVPESYSSLDDLVLDLEDRFKKQLVNCQVPNMVFDLLKRKLQKVKEYVRTV